ncbi:hypothetical protein QYZ87_01215 [Porphyromonadaceae bacterium W3.11]|nr:hypothetical protein [Porphyromonadaceae bacterium W3.11]
MNKRYLILMVMLIALAGCRAKQPVIQQVPIKEITQVELKTIELPGDSVLIRVPLERLSNGTQTSGVSVSPKGLQLLWQLRQGMLELQARHPPERVEYPETTTIKEVPVEVVREIEVSHLHWWQKALMWIGVISIIYISIKEGMENAPRKL